MQFDLHHLAALAAVLRLGSFEAAAAALNVTPPAISQRIKALEERVGAPLITRGQPCIGTEQGLRIAKHAEDVALLERQLTRELHLEVGDVPARLKVAVNADSLATWFVAAMQACDGVLFDLVVDDQDHSSDWLRRGEVSAAVTAQARPVAGCDAYPLGALAYMALASPDFMARWFGDGVTPQSIARAPCMVFNAKDRLQHNWLAANLGNTLSPPSHFLPSTHAFTEAACAGVGWGLNPVILAQPHLEAGRLVEMIAGSSLTTPLYWQVSRIMAPALREITQAVRTAARQHLQQSA